MKQGAGLLRIIGIGCFVLAVWLGEGPIARGQDTIVQPGDIATPTPTALPLPTPTPGSESVQFAPTPPTPVSGNFSDMPLTSPAGMDIARGYTVRTGDTLFTVALEMGIDLDDIPCAIAPDFTAQQPLVIGDTLSPFPATLACHTVLSGDTLATVAAQYGSSVEQIYLLPWNRLASVPVEAIALQPGAHLRVPLPLSAFGPSKTVLPAEDNRDGMTSTNFLPLMLAMPLNASPFDVLGAAGQNRSDTSHQALGPLPADWPYGSGHFTWPVYGWLSQSYRYDHRAIDIAANQGTPVTAADRGIVIRAGWNDQGYGRFVVIDHQIDYVTLYAHLDRILVSEGDIVGQGQVVGVVGSTGNSTGPHLHFEIRDFGRLTNPLELLAVP